MNNAGFPEKPQKSSSLPGEDIPAALRDTPNAGEKKSQKPIILILAGITVFVVLAAVTGFSILKNSSDQSAKVGDATTTSSTSSTSDGSTNKSQPKNDALLGHLPYSEAPASELMQISGQMKMRKSAALKYQEMSRNARQAGVNLVPISGFRAINSQEQLFFDIGARRNQTPAQRASVSAPPGHSEHHTGYAVDIGDGAVPSTNLSPKFENTKAFKWLENNAARYGFELSFPKNNSQGVSYEPWHWRFVGDRHSLETFYKARNLKPVKPSE
ncbi:MAG: D-alanyl-D-alanine carboxypeptidase family protein [Cyanobacteria bacterium P01_A01_bin.84]